MSDYITILAAIASIIAVVSVIPYFWHIYKGDTKPHAFSWLVWGTLAGVAFAAQLISGAGIASVVLGITVLTNLTIAGIGFYQGHVKFSRFDWISLSGAFLAIVLWQITKNPLWAVILVSISDVVGYLPTFRKGYYFPYEENIPTFVLGAVYLLTSIAALESHALVNWLYPFVMSCGNIVFITMLLVRRRQIS